MGCIGLKEICPEIQGRNHGNGAPMHEVCILHRIPRTWNTAWVKQEEEADS